MNDVMWADKVKDAKRNKRKAINKAKKQGALNVWKQVVKKIKKYDTELEQSDLILEIEKRIKKLEGGSK